MSDSEYAGKVLLGILKCGTLSIPMTFLSTFERGRHQIVNGIENGMNQLNLEISL